MRLFLKALFRLIQTANINFILDGAFSSGCFYKKKTLPQALPADCERKETQGNKKSAMLQLKQRCVQFCNSSVNNNCVSLAFWITELYQPIKERRGGDICHEYAVIFEFICQLR